MSVTLRSFLQDRNKRDKYTQHRCVYDRKQGLVIVTKTVTGCYETYTKTYIKADDVCEQLLGLTPGTLITGSGISPELLDNHPLTEQGEQMMRNVLMKHATETMDSLRAKRGGKK